MNVTAGAMTITNGANISASAFDTGDGGSITVNVTGALAIDGTHAGAGDNTGLIAIADPVDPTSVVRSGEITVAAGSVSIGLGGQVSADTLGAGPAGQIHLTAAALTVDGGGQAGAFTGISSNALPAFDADGLPTVPTTGNGGDVRLDTGRACPTGRWNGGGAVELRRPQRQHHDRQRRGDVAGRWRRRHDGDAGDRRRRTGLDHHRKPERRRHARDHAQRDPERQHRHV